MRVPRDPSRNPKVLIKKLSLDSHIWGIFAGQMYIQNLELNKKIQLTSK